VRLMKIMKPIAKMKKDLKSDEKQSGDGAGSGGKATSKGGEYSMHSLAYCHMHSTNFMLLIFT
jgi:hypothetical protein